jgi:hypothetical protein
MCEGNALMMACNAKRISSVLTLVEIFPTKKLRIHYCLLKSSREEGTEIYAFIKYISLHKIFYT